eukprot:449412_1
MAMSFEKLAAVDKFIIIFGVLIYIIVVWIPMFISLYLVYHRPNDKRSEKEFDQKWYKWKKQYMWHELWYRSHVIWVISITVVFIFESWPIAVPFIAVIGFVLITMAIKYASKKVENRVPSDDEKKSLYTQVTGTMRSQSDARDYIHEINQEMKAEKESKNIKQKMSTEIELQNKTKTGTHHE